MSRIAERIPTLLSTATCLLLLSGAPLAQEGVWVTGSAPNTFWGTIPATFGKQSNGLVLFGVTSGPEMAWESWVGMPNGAGA